ncbi:MAG: hypothetical protein NT018_09245 [Armatimonadetes bacterium]|nr:hypothetical protein [Armatimonadota bacterium]
MLIRISAQGITEALSDVHTAELASLAAEICGCNPDSEQIERDRNARLGLLEAIVTVLTSATAIQLAKAVRDYVNRREVEV